jgi:hypothetical protein
MVARNETVAGVVPATTSSSGKPGVAPPFEMDARPSRWTRDDDDDDEDARVASTTEPPQTRARAQMRWHPAARRIPHTRQTYNWDCGLACVAMALNSMGEESTTATATVRTDDDDDVDDDFASVDTIAAATDLRVLRRLCRTTSIWTVDLAHLLRRFGADVTFATVTIGANPAYASESFYSDTLREDRGRVESLFDAATERGVAIERRSASLEELKAKTRTGEYLIIALVDKRKLARLALEAGGAGGRLGGGGSGYEARDAQCFDGAAGGGASTSRAANASENYTGHYVVLCGYDPADDVFLCRDPACAVADLVVPASAVETSRRSFGTDEVRFISHWSPYDRVGEVNADP